MKRLFRKWPTLALVFLVACSESAPAELSDLVVVIDSAGVELVEIGPAAFEEVRSVSLDSPQVVLGANAAEPEALFGRVVDATRLAGGEVAVADGYSGAILTFSAAGSLVRSVGGPGQGPGEFTSITSIAAKGDTLLAFDSGSWRITAFAPDGGLHQEVRLQPHTEHADKTFGPPGVDRVFVHWWRADRYPGDGTETGPLADSLMTVVDRLDTGGAAQVDSLRATRLGYAILSEEEYEQRSSESGRPFAVAAVLPLPLADRALVALLPDGVVVGRSDDFELHRFDANGELVQIVRGDRPRRAGSEFSRGVLADWYATSIPDRSLHALARSLIRETGAPDRLGHFSSIASGDDGELWLKVAAGPEFGDAAEWFEWLKITRDGVPSLRLRAPADLEVLEFGDGHVLGVHRDPMEVETVQVYEIPAVQEGRPSSTSHN